MVVSKKTFNDFSKGIFNQYTERMQETVHKHIISQQSLLLQTHIHEKRHPEHKRFCSGF